jgi:hypothetical protein
VPCGSKKLSAKVSVSLLLCGEKRNQAFGQRHSAMSGKIKLIKDLQEKDL